MANINKPVFDTDDVQLLKAISRHGFVDMNYVYKFYKTNCKRDTVKRRIRQLNIHRFIHIEKMFEPGGYTISGKEGYSALCLDRAGLNYMSVMGYDVPNYTSLLTKAAPYRIYHQVQVATVCDSIFRAYKERDGLMVPDRVLNEREATLRDQENQPDAMMLFKYRSGSGKGEGLIAVFVELERSYARWQRIDAKITAYHNAIKKRKYIKELKLPIVGYRLLFVSQTTSQFKTLKGKIELCAKIESIDVLIAQYKDVCNHPTSRVYITPGNENKFGLLSDLKQPSKDKDN